MVANVSRLAQITKIDFPIVAESIISSGKWKTFKELSMSKSQIITVASSEAVRSREPSSPEMHVIDLVCPKALSSTKCTDSHVERARLNSSSEPFFIPTTIQLERMTLIMFGDPFREPLACDCPAYTPLKYMIYPLMVTCEFGERECCSSSRTIVTIDSQSMTSKSTIVRRKYGARLLSFSRLEQIDNISQSFKLDMRDNRKLHPVVIETALCPKGRIRKFDSDLRVS